MATAKPDLGWPVARPIAHRGLHDLAPRAIEAALGGRGRDRRGLRHRIATCELTADG